MKSNRRKILELGKAAYLASVALKSSLDELEKFTEGDSSHGNAVFLHGLNNPIVSIVNTIGEMAHTAILDDDDNKAPRGDELH